MTRQSRTHWPGKKSWFLSRAPTEIVLCSQYRRCVRGAPIVNDGVEDGGEQGRGCSRRLEDGGEGRGEGWRSLEGVARAEGGAAGEGWSGGERGRGQGPARSTRSRRRWWVHPGVLDELSAALWGTPGCARSACHGLTGASLRQARAAGGDAEHIPMRRAGERAAWGASSRRPEAFGPTAVSASRTPCSAIAHGMLASRPSARRFSAHQRPHSVGESAFLLTGCTCGQYEGADHSRGGSEMRVRTIPARPGRRPRA